jgi:hypothetical protein
MVSERLLFLFVDCAYNGFIVIITAYFSWVPVSTTRADFLSIIHDPALSVKRFYNGLASPVSLAPLRFCGGVALLPAPVIEYQRCP